MQPPPIQLPPPGTLGPDPEPLGTERYARLIMPPPARSAAAPAKPKPGPMFELKPIENRPLTLSPG